MTRSGWNEAVADVLPDGTEIVYRLRRTGRRVDLWLWLSGGKLPVTVEAEHRGASLVSLRIAGEDVVVRDVQRLPLTRLLTTARERALRDVASRAPVREAGDARARGAARDELLRRVAALYREEVLVSPRGVYARMQTRMNDAYSEPYLRELVRAARQTTPALLGPTRPGHAGETAPSRGDR